MTKTTLSRRTLLRGALAGGATVSVPLPRLASMLNGNGTALAAGSELQPRFGTWFFGNGVLPSSWDPRLQGVGDAWQLSESLLPLIDVKPWLTVLSGFRISVTNTFAHKSSPAQALTGAQAVQKGDVQLPSIDQRIAALIGQGKTYPTGIHVGLSKASGNGALDLNVSFRGPNAPNQPNYSPANLFGKLVAFSGAKSTPDPSLLRRARVIDAVNQDAKSLKLRLGQEDKIRLDHHISGLDELQTQIMGTIQRQGSSTLMLTDPEKSYPNMGADGTITRKRHQAFSDLLVFALASDLTNVFTNAFSGAASHGSYVDAGLDNVTFHEDYGHRESPRGREAATAGFLKGVAYAMTNLADLATRMKNTPDGAGNLLDNTCIYVTSCTGDAPTHNDSNYPILILGKAGGKLKGNLSYRKNFEIISKVPFTLLKMFGGTDTKFGLGQGVVASEITELYA